MFHQHNFQEVERFYAEPSKLNVEEAQGEMAKQLIEKCAFGQTTILYQCIDNIRECRIKDGCGKTYKEEILGKSLK